MERLIDVETIIKIAKNNNAKITESNTDLGTIAIINANGKIEDLFVDTSEDINE